MTAVVNVDVVGVVSRGTVVDQLTRVRVTTAVLAVTGALKQQRFIQRCNALVLFCVTR